jgi:TRAP-type C4-dicarboxylate transport system permease small subunit
MKTAGGAPAPDSRPLDRVLGRIDRVLTLAVTALLVTAFALMLGLAALQVFLRAALHTAVPWGDLAARQLVIWVGFFGAYLATRGGKHFHIDALARLLPAGARAWMTAGIDLLTAAVCAFLVRAAVAFVTTGLDPRAVLFLGIPQTAAALIVPVGFGLVALQLLLKAVAGAAAAVRKPKGGVEPRPRGGP